MVGKVSDEGRARYIRGQKWRVFSCKDGSCRDVHRRDRKSLHQEAKSARRDKDEQGGATPTPEVVVFKVLLELFRRLDDNSKVFGSQRLVAMRCRRQIEFSPSGTPTRKERETETKTRSTHAERARACAVLCGFTKDQLKYRRLIRGVGLT